MEVFSRMIEAASNAGFIFGFSLSRLGSDVAEMKIFHFLFADDTIVFCDNDSEQIVNLRVSSFGFKRYQG